MPRHFKCHEAIREIIATLRFLRDRRGPNSILIQRSHRQLLLYSIDSVSGVEPNLFETTGLYFTYDVRII